MTDRLPTLPPEDAIVTASGIILPRDFEVDDFGHGLWTPDVEEREPEFPDRRRPVRGTSISLFSGCGGFDLGTTMAGFETRVFIESDKYAASTLKHNAKAAGWEHAVIFDCKIETISVQQVLIAARLDRGECDLLTGGFPCQPFSTASSTRKGTKDNRGHLFYECKRMIDGIQPKVFLLENVPGILTSSGGKDIEIICNEFASLGYDFGLAKFNAANYGVPQHRERIMFLGIRPDIGKNAVTELLGMVEGATHYDPATGLPSFQPVWKWNGEALVQQNEPKRGQHKKKSAVARDDEGANDDLTLFGAAS